jgi:hypothetical protein
MGGGEIEPLEQRENGVGHGRVLRMIQGFKRAWMEVERGNSPDGK